MCKSRSFKSILSFALVMILFVLAGTTAFASEAKAASPSTEQNNTATVENLTTENSVTPRMNSYGTGRWYLGHFAFTDTNTGNAFILNGNRVRMCVAFKKADSQASDVDLQVDLARVEYVNGREYHHYRGGQYFMSANDEPDSDGYVYFVSDWIDISSESGCAFLLKYEVFTAYYQSGTSPRRADVHVWLDVQ